MDRRDAGAAVSADWDRRFEAYRAEHPGLAAEFERRMRGELPADWQDVLPSLDGKAATRQHSGAVINALADTLPELFGGSADLAGSNNTDVDDGGDFSAQDRLGRNLRFGIREHGMSAIANGMALHGGILPYVATFLVFTDYCRPSIRLASLMHQRVVFVMTHDSIGLGEDGPTHQPIEHLAALRAIPGLQVLRPADGDEVVGAWAAALRYDGPSVIALTRQAVPPAGDKPGGPVAAVARGAYVIRDVDDPDIVLIGTGSELQLALSAAEQLAADEIRARVVSMPSWELFQRRSADERATVLPVGVPRVSVEAGTTFGWERWVGDGGRAIGIGHFGASAPAPVLFEAFGFTAEAVAQAARDLLGR